MYKTVIFDLDGTLLDTSKDIQKVLNQTLAHFSLPTLPIEKVKEYVGNGAKTLIQRAIPADANVNFSEVFDYYSVRYAQCDNSLTTLYEGEEQTLIRLKEKGVKLALVTNKPQAATVGVYDSYLKKFGFDFVMGNTNEYPLKPNPALALLAAKNTNTNVEDCLFVGDGETDVQTAQNAKMDGLAVLWGFRTKEQLKAVGAVNFANTYKQLECFVLAKK